MAKVVYCCLRKTLETVSRRICPDNIEPRPPRIVEDRGLIAAVFSPSAAVRVAGASICAGHLTDDRQWNLPGERSPEGAFALFRADRATVEVLTDAVASRNAWYYFDDEILIAATTQRAIVAVLGSFDFDRATIPWMLTNGSLGPVPSWDARVKRLRPDSRLSLDRERWHLSVVAKQISFAGQDGGAGREALLRCLKSAFAPIRFDYGKWMLPLSGGYDSRGILCLLPEIAGIRTITWGAAASQRQRDNDAVVAHEVAAALGVQHEFRVTDRADESAQRILARFVVAGEGCIDHVSAYMDGFAIWKSLYNEGVEGVIRGDEGFGWTSVTSPADVLRGMGISLWSDYANLPSLESLGFTPHVLPEDLQRHPVESLEQWRDRLYHQYRIPTMLAALNDLKLHYVEVANPLLARPILEFVRSLPDAQRTEKRLFRAVVDRIGPRIRIARYPANAELRSVLKNDNVVLVLRAALSSHTAGAILPQSFLRLVDAGIEVQVRAAKSGSNSRFRSLARRLARLVIKARGSQKIDFNALAFRIFLICRMHELLSEDAHTRDSGHASQKLS
jgi:Asparagine synthase